MKLYEIVKEKTIKYISEGKIKYKCIYNLDNYNYNIIYNDLHKLDFDLWKNKLYHCLVDIESINWTDVDIMYPFFHKNTFQNHYSDIIIKTETDIKTIYQFHNPYWKIYFNKALDFIF